MKWGGAVIADQAEGDIMTNRMARWAIAIVCALAPAAGQAAFTVDCTFGTGGDLITRGFFVSNYQGSSIERVALAHSAAVEGERTISLTMRLNTFDGTFLGVATVTRDITTENSISVFDFGSIAVPVGSLVTFTQTLVAGAGSVYFDYGVGPCTDIIETNGTSAPLSTFRRASVGIVIQGAPANIASAMNLDCPFDPDASAGDLITRGFYVKNYRGTTIDLVKLRHATGSDNAGTKTILLVARLGSYDGPILGTASVTRSVTASGTESVFDFGDVPVQAMSTIAFTQSLTAGTTPVYYDLGFESCDDVVQTQGTSPPLDSVRRDRVGVKIVGRVASDAPKLAVEYFHTGFGHYFTTADADEIYGLDHGAYGGVFVRTGETFYVHDGPVPGTADICRFFTVTFAPKSSHFYTGDPVECAGVKLNPDWQYEKIAYFLKPAAGGTCPIFWTRVFRMYNNGMTGAPNHRFTTDESIYVDFTTNRGWAPEGVRFCAPFII